MKMCEIGILGLLFFLSISQTQSDTVDIQRLRAHERFLASDALQGRGSATHDEQIAAIYVASQFEAFHLKADPKTGLFTQQIEMVTPALDGRATLSISRVSMQEKVDFRLMASAAQAVKGKLMRADPYELKRLKAGRGDAVLFRFHDASPETVFPAVIAAHSAGAQLILLAGSETLERELAGMPDVIRSRFADGTQGRTQRGCGDGDPSQPSGSQEDGDGCRWRYCLDLCEGGRKIVADYL